MKVKYSKWIVAIVIALNSLFAIATFFVFYHTGNEPTTLVAAWFAFTTGELWILSGLEKSKRKTEVTEYYEQDV